MTSSSSGLVRALNGPILLITLGILLTLDYFDGLSFWRRTWPVLLIVFGIVKLLERPERPRTIPPSPPPASSPGELL